MIKQKIGLGLIALCLIGAQGCSHSSMERDIDEKLAQETDIKSSEDLQQTSANLIENAPGLTAEQRTKLMSLRNELRGEFAQIKEESLKLRALLIKNVIASSHDYNRKEVMLIKKRIKKLEKRRTTTLFKAVERADTILGRNANENQRLIGSLLERDGAGRY